MSIAQEPALSPPEFLPRLTDREARLSAALDSTTELDFLETPLREVVGYLRDYHHIPVALDRRSLAEAGIPEDLPLTIRLKDVRLGPALRQLLKQRDLAYTVVDEFLLVTTPEVAESTLFTRVYPVGGIALGDYTTIEEAVTSAVLPTTWDQVGGPGSIAFVDQTQSMIVSQTHLAHEEVLRLLRALRAAPRNGPFVPPRGGMGRGMGGVSSKGGGFFNLPDNLPRARPIQR